MPQQEELERLKEAIDDVRKLKLKDVQLDHFASKEKYWRSFKISLNCTLTDFDLEDVIDGTEEFPFPEDMDDALLTQLHESRVLKRHQDMDSNLSQFLRLQGNFWRLAHLSGRPKSKE